MTQGEIKSIANGDQHSRGRHSEEGIKEENLCLRKCQKLRLISVSFTSTSLSGGVYKTPGMILFHLDYMSFGVSSADYGFKMINVIF